MPPQIWTKTRGDGFFFLLNNISQSKKLYLELLLKSKCKKGTDFFYQQNLKLFTNEEELCASVYVWFDLGYLQGHILDWRPHLTVRKKLIFGSIIKVRVKERLGSVYG